ncbi:hypothetical protein CQA53_09450, partial [Helicobacter didelphidarum]
GNPPRSVDSIVAKLEKLTKELIGFSLRSLELSSQDEAKTFYNNTNNDIIDSSLRGKAEAIHNKNIILSDSKISENANNGLPRFANANLTMTQKQQKDDFNTLKSLLESLPTPPPQGWEKKKLGEIVSVQSGGTPSRGNANYWNGTISWLKSEVCQNCYVYENQVKEKITDDGLQHSSAKILKKDSVLIALVGATIGKAGYLTFESATNQNIAGLYPLDEKILKSKFLYYSCFGLYPQFKSLGGFSMANLTFIKNLQIPLPPLEAQDIIVQTIDFIESQIDSINTQIKNIESKKEEILHNALTIGGGGGNLDTLEKELANLYIRLNFYRYIKDYVLEQCGLKPSLQSLIESITPLFETMSKTRKNYKFSNKEFFSLQIGKRVLDNELNPNGKIPVYSANVLKPFGFIDKEILKDYRRDSVLWGIDGDWSVGFMPKNQPFYPTDHCGVLQVIGNTHNARYVGFSLEYAGLKAGFDRNLRASIERISNLSLSLPPKEAQDTIVQTIDFIESQISYLHSNEILLSEKKEEILRELLY